MNGRDGPAMKLMEAAMVGSCLGVVAIEMPFVYQTGAIAGCREHRGNGGVLRKEIGTMDIGGVAAWINLYAYTSAYGTLIVAYARVSGVQACHERTARGR